MSFLINKFDIEKVSNRTTANTMIIGMNRYLKDTLITMDVKASYKGKQANTHRCQVTHFDVDEAHKFYSERIETHQKPLVVEAAKRYCKIFDKIKENKQKDQAIQILMLIYTATTIIKNKTPKVSKLAKHIMKFLVKHKDTVGEWEYNLLAKKANKIWIKAQDKLGKEYTIHMNQLIGALWSNLDGNPYQTIGCKEKTVTNAVNSLLGAGNHEEKKELTDNSNLLADYFAKAIGIERENKLRAIKEKYLKDK